MGSDLCQLSSRMRERDGIRYRDLRYRLAKMLGLQVAHDVTGPGDHTGATDDEICARIDHLKSMQESAEPRVCESLDGRVFSDAPQHFDCEIPSRPEPKTQSKISNVTVNGVPAEEVEP